RILFLKLIEANLLHFNNFDNFDKNLRFLTSTKITSFSILAHLFFEVLAKDYAERKQDKGFNFLPYLNSSLFIRDEKEICDLSALDDALEILPFATTQTEYKKREPVRFLTYLFDFLECFDFGKSQDSTPSDKLINSSVLGAMFEKLNGYQEGSFYTPNFITSYMCKESLQKIVLDRFNTAFSWSAKDLESLRKQIDRNFDKESKFKKLLESIRICDPSVGSGHFLVSALNEMIAIYHKLGLLGFGYKDLQIKDDEIHLTTKEGEKFAYKRLQDSNHTIQIALFTLKKSIIENNLFGVDINPNSCNIARLRLWIELLKNAYYLNFSKDQNCKIHKLQTLPNIDINIKCGNSLISRFNLSDSLRTIPNINFQIEQYKKLVFEYKNADQSLITISKKDIEKQIETIQATFTLTLKDPKTKRELEKAIESHIKQFNNYLLDDESLLEGLNSLQFNLFGTPTLSKEEQERALESYGKIQALRKKLDLALSGETYKNAFEWRFAFPEVLDSNGDFLGFDLVIGNPPYIRIQGLNKQVSEQYKKSYQAATKNYDIYVLFVEMGLKIVKPNAPINFIMPHKWLNADFGEGLRNLVKNKAAKIIHFGDFQVFKASTYTALHWFNHQAKNLQFIKSPDSIQTEQEMTEFLNSITQDDLRIFPHKDLDSRVWNLSGDKTQNILMKILQHPSARDIFEKIYVGIATSKDSVYFLEQCKETSKGLIKGYSKELGLIVEIESDFAKPLLMGSSFHRYEKLESDLRVIFPYFKEVDSKGKEKMSLYSELDLQTHFPKGYAYLKQCEQVLRAREKGRFDTDKWYQFGRAQGLKGENIEKLLCPDICNNTHFSLDFTGKFYFSATIYGYIQSEEFKHLDYKYLLAILNSKLTWWFLQKISVVMRGGFYRIKPAYIENFCIPNLTPKEQKPFIALADKILKLKAKDSTTNTSTLESEIDKLVYKLYNLNENEINIIEDK
ncbi:MAG: Eco57I restriction-modification methylase domain-containing protein, partial [Helicobacter sp.]|nr:Eco57I restriction-modification methylase domain-containing protein [Helicobacter sp.]